MPVLLSHRCAWAAAGSLWALQVRPAHLRGCWRPVSGPAGLSLGPVAQPLVACRAQERQQSNSEGRCKVSLSLSACKSRVGGPTPSQAPSRVLPCLLRTLPCISKARRCSVEAVGSLLRLHGQRARVNRSRGVCNECLYSNPGSPAACSRAPIAYLCHTCRSLTPSCAAARNSLMPSPTAPDTVWATALSCSKRHICSADLAPY